MMKSVNYFALSISLICVSCNIQPEEIEKYIDTNLLDDENKKKLQAVQEDDNPIIVKYQIKK